MDGSNKRISYKKYMVKKDRFLYSYLTVSQSVTYFQVEHRTFKSELLYNEVMVMLTRYYVPWKNLYLIFV